MMQRPYLAIVGIGFPILIFALQELNVIESSWLLWVVAAVGATLVRQPAYL